MRWFALFITSLLVLLFAESNAQQLGINTDIPQATLDVVSVNSGILIPRITLTGTNDIVTVPSPTVSEFIYNTVAAGSGATAVTPGFYFWDGTMWARLSVGSDGGDHDWYEAGATAPDNINDDIYTFGNVSIGLPVGLEQLHVAGNIRVDGDTIMTEDNVATNFVILSNGGVVIKLDNNDDATGEEFSIKKSGVDLNSKVFTVTEGGNTDADGWGVFGGKGEFNGDLTLLGNSRDLIVKDNFDIIGTSSVDIFLDSDANNTATTFAIKNELGIELLAIAEDSHLTLYPYGVTAGETGGLRLRELAANGSNYIEIQTVDNLGANYVFTWPSTDGTANQFLQTDGSGVLNWVTIGTGVTSITTGNAITNTGTATVPILNVATDNLTISNSGPGGTLQVIGLPPGDGDYIQNQNAIAQSGARYYIAGDGTVSDFNITGGDLYGPGIFFGTNGLLKMYSQTDFRVVLDNDNNGSQSFQINKNGSNNNADKVFEVFETGVVQAVKSFGMLENDLVPTLYTRIQSGDLTSNLTFTLPITYGNSGNFLQTDGTGVLSWNDGSSLKDHDFYEVGGTTPANNINDNIYTQGSVGMGTATPDHKLDVRGYAAAYNIITTIPLWLGSGFVMNNIAGQDLANCEAGFDPLLYDEDGNVEVRLVVRLNVAAPGNVNFRLRTHDGTTQSFPILDTDAWTYANTQTGQVAISPWKDWSAGVNPHEIHLYGWVNNACACSATFNNAYLQVRADQP